MLLVTLVEKLLIANLLDGWSMVEDFSLHVKMLLEPEILNLAMFLLEQEENHQVITLLLPQLLVIWMKLMVMISLVKESMMMKEMLSQVMLMSLLMLILGFKLNLLILLSNALLLVLLILQADVSQEVAL